MKKKTHEEFLQELKDKNISLVPLEPYKGASTKILFRCKNGHEISITPHNVLCGSSCAICNNRVRLTHEQFLEKLYAITDKYTPLEQYISTHTKLLCRCNICNHEWKVEPSKLLSGRGCPECNKRKGHNTGNYKYTKETILKKLESKNIKLLDEYEGMNKQNHFKCLVCGYEYKTSLSHIICGDTGCRKCLHKSITMKHEEFIDRANKLLPELEIISKYTGRSKKVRYICKVCGLNHSVYANNLLRGYGCPICNVSKGEKKCKKYLDEHNIKNIPQYEFEGLVGIKGKNLRYDFGITDDNEMPICMLEYDGIFHYEKQYDDDGYETIQIHDKIKNNFCERNNIPLIRIPYWEYDNIEKILDNYFNNNDLTYVVNKDKKNIVITLGKNEE